MLENEYKQEISEYVDNRLEDLWKLSNYIYEHAEIGFKEYKTSKKIIDVLKQEGFEVEPKVGGLDTSFVATYSNNSMKKPRIDILCEYDALDLGEALPEGKRIAHACGHNIIASTGVGAGIAMKYLLEKYQLPGEIRVVGTPAEEGGGGKIIMQEHGVFDETDAMILLHPTSGKSKIAGRCKSGRTYQVTYHGKPAHSGNHREKGINAHDAAVICYTSIGLLRYQTTDDIQLFVHFTDVGKEKGVIPSIAKLEIQLKSFNPNTVELIAPKIKNCIEAGALATGCSVEYEEKIGYLGRIYNHTFEKCLRANFELLNEPLKEGMVDDNGGEDFGNLMRKVPGIMPYPSLIPEKRVALHTEDYLKLVTTPRAKYVVGLGSKVMADTVLDLLLHPEIIEEAKIEMQHELEKEKIE
ncbi:amidohydrolase [Faecalicoccus pleomorphus]|uniref:amidohydrolase n=1 Tax=Faecalicoccus pleomorphus TaxID=1323 RepID=UPI00242D6CC5|nr:amidohydrolase [Faecalicoccus pleomorphus]